MEISFLSIRSFRSGPFERYDFCNVIYLLLLSFTQTKDADATFSSSLPQKENIHHLVPYSSTFLYWLSLNYRKFCHVFMDLFPNERSTWMMLLCCSVATTFTLYKQHILYGTYISYKLYIAMRQVKFRFDLGLLLVYWFSFPTAVIDIMPSAN